MVDALDAAHERGIVHRDLKPGTIGLTLIARQVAWSPDGQHLYASVSKTDGDIVTLDGLV